MRGLLEAYPVVVSVAVVLAALAALHAHHRSRGRWGWSRVPLGESGEGAYRSAERHADVARRAPGAVLGAGLSARVWAALTVLVFVPAGGLATLLMVALGEEHAFSTLFGILVGLLVLSGLGLGVGLVRSAVIIEQRRVDDDVREVVRWSFVHHALVALVFVAEGALLDPQAFALAIVTVVPVCAVGAGVAVALRRASRVVEASVDAERLAAA